MEEIVRAYEYEKGRFVVIEEELLNVPGEPLHTVEILDFVRLAEIDPIYFARPYYLAPGLGGEKAYALLHRTMQEQGQVAVARTRLRSKESLVALRVFRQVLLMSQMYYHDEIRPVDAVLLPGKNVELTATELKMASELIGNLSGSFQPEKYQDQYRKRLEEAIAAKIAGEEVKIAPAAPAAKVVDLVEALKASLEMTKEKRDEKVRKRRKKKEAAAGNR
jgi:DNA end-binding protein Ku